MHRAQIHQKAMLLVQQSSFCSESVPDLEFMQVAVTAAGQAASRPETRS